MAFTPESKTAAAEVNAFAFRDQDTKRNAGGIDVGDAIDLPTEYSPARPRAGFLNVGFN